MECISRNAAHDTACWGPKIGAGVFRELSNRSSNRSAAIRQSQLCRSRRFWARRLLLDHDARGDELAGSAFLCRPSPESCFDRRRSLAAPPAGLDGDSAPQRGAGGRRSEQLAACWSRARSISDAVELGYQTSGPICTGMAPSVRWRGCLLVALHKGGLKDYKYRACFLENRINGAPSSGSPCFGRRSRNRIRPVAAFLPSPSRRGDRRGCRRSPTVTTIDHARARPGAPADLAGG